MRDLPEILREYRVQIVPVPAGGRRRAHDLGQRTKFGGTPDHVQSPNDDDDPLTCPRCFQRMHFVAQLDSFEFNDPDNANSRDHDDCHFMFGDVGMIYVWFCFNCLTPHASMECS